MTTPQDAMDQKIKEIQEDIKTNKIMMYVKGSKMAPMCGFSAQVIHIFNQLNVPFETKNVLEDDILRSAIKQFSDWPTIPQIYINGEFIGGCDIITELYQNKELEKLVQA